MRNGLRPETCDALLETMREIEGRAERMLQYMRANEMATNKVEQYGYEVIHDEFDKVK